MGEVRKKKKKKKKTLPGAEEFFREKRSGLSE
jgi:hypothetical protein